MVTARLGFDPSRDFRGALTAPQPKHYGAIVDAKLAGELLRAIDGYEGHVKIKLAMQLSAHVFVRLGELRHADWREIDLVRALWIIPAENEDAQAALHPLSRQSVALFNRVRQVTGPSGYVFSSIRTNSRQ